MDNEEKKTPAWYVAVPQHAGVSVAFEGRGFTALIVPPLSLGALRTLTPRLATFTGDMSLESLDTAIQVVWTALRRNYPTISQIDVEEILDVANFQTAVEATMDVAGAKRKVQAAQAAPGESLTQV